MWLRRHLMCCPSVMILILCLTLRLQEETVVSAFSPSRWSAINNNCRENQRQRQKYISNSRHQRFTKLCNSESSGLQGEDSSDTTAADTDTAVEFTAGYSITPVLVSLDDDDDDCLIEPNNSNNNKLEGGNRNQCNRVNSATLQFNNKLNRQAKNWDANTAPKVEAMLLEAVDNYQQFQAARQEGSNEEEELEEIITPNTVSFTNAITAWARCTRKDAAKRAQALLQQMHTLYKTQGWYFVKPNKVSYNSVITAWARSRERGSAKKAEDLLHEMYEYYNQELEEGSGDEDDLKPDSRSWNAVINAVARSRDEKCADRAKHLLDNMGRLYNEGDTDLLPDALTFGAIINAYANSFEEGASDKAAQLLMHMESLYQMGFENAKPTTFVYNACMNAFAKDPLISSNTTATDSGEGATASMNRAEQAEQLLNSMEKRYEEERDHRINPDCISYSTVINAYANSATPQSGVHADAILRRMTHRYLMGDTKCRPNAVSFTAAMKAHSAAINATLSALPEDEREGEQKANGIVQASAKRCEDLLQQLTLLYQSPGGDRTLKPTAVTFELVSKALQQAGDDDGAERVKMLRSDICP